MRRWAASSILALALAVPAAAQTDRVTADEFRFTGTCLVTSGAGSPESAVTGSPCDVYLQTDVSGAVGIWTKASGSATNTGWQQLPGLGLANTWTATQAFAASGVTFGADANLYRYAANALRTDDTFHAVSSITTGGLFQTATTTPRFNSYETDAAADEKHWEWIGDAGQFYVRTLDDSYRNPVAVFGFDRTGTTPSIAWLNTTLRPYVDNTYDLGHSSYGWRSLYLDGTITIGGDTNLYRSAANVLATDDVVSVGAGAWLDYTTTSTDSNGLVMYVGDGAAARNGYWNVDVQSPTYQYLRVIQNLAGGGEVLEWRFGPSSLAPGVHWANDLGEDATRVRTLYAAELNVWQLVARTVTASIGGEIWTAETTKLTADLASGGTTITVNDNNLANGDRIVLKSLTNVEWMAVASVAGGSAGAYTYTVTRNLDGTGANAWVSGQAVVSTGTTGNGFISQYAESSGALSGAVGPATAYIVRTGTTWSDLAARAVVGNLNGTYGYSAETWGFAAGDPSNAWIKIDATNGIRIGHDATTKISLDASGNAAFTGSVTAASGTIGGWTLGSTSLTDTAGAVGLSSAVTAGDDIRFWAGHATPGSAPFRVTEAGVLTATSGTMGGFTLAANLLSSGTDADYVGMSSAGTNAFWAGDSTFADAEFSVTAAGVLKATSATLTGTLYTPYVEISGSAGILFDAGGDDNERSIRWDDGSSIRSRTDASVFQFIGGAGSQINFYSGYMKLWGGSATGDQCLYLDDGELSPGDVGVMDLGSLALPWGDAWFTGVVRAQDNTATLGNGTYYFDEAYIDLSTTTSNLYPMAWDDTSKQLLAKTDGTDGVICGSGVDDLTLEHGIVTSYTCATPEASPAARITALEAEVAALRALVLDLMGRAGSARQ